MVEKFALSTIIYRVVVVYFQTEAPFSPLLQYLMYTFAFASKKRKFQMDF